EPVKVRPGYVKFLPEWAPVNLALSDGAHHRGDGTINHVGVQVDSPALVQELLGRVKASGFPVREEMGVNCCHANQDNFWGGDPEGVEWEVSHLNYDLEDQIVGRGLKVIAAAMEAEGGACCSR